MKIINTYIFRKYFSSFFLTLFLMIFICVIFDFSEKIDDFVDSEASTKDILFKYYLNFIPYLANLFSPLFAFIATIYFTSKMTYNNEFMGILNSGYSYRKILLNYFACSLIVFGCNCYLSNFVIPHANKERISFEKENFKKKKTKFAKHKHIKISDKNYVYVSMFDDKNKRGYNFTLEQIEQKIMNYKIECSQIQWIEEKNKWELLDCRERFFYKEHERITKINKKDTTINLHPDDLKIKTNDFEIMNYYQLNEFILKEIEKGSDKLDYFYLEKYKRISFPFSIIILTMLASIIGTKKIKGGTGLHLGLGIISCFAYILFMQFSTSFVINSNLSPMLGVWIPNIIFALFVLYLTRFATK